MNVSRSSWHYRLFRYVHNTSRGPAYLNPFTKLERNDAELPGSLCPYAWSIFLGLLGGLFLIALFAALSPLFLVGFLLVRLYGWGRRLDAAIARKRGPRKPKREKEPEPPRERKPSIVAAYVRSRKEKVCPTIRLVD